MTERAGDTPPEAEALVAFWRDAGRERWFASDPAFDAACRRWLPLQEAAGRGALDSWEESPQGALALVLLLDQLPRNLHRGDPRAWATDPQAQATADRALARRHDLSVQPELRQFFLLPFMHAEDLSCQDRSVALYEATGDPDTVRWARHHRDIVARFGRFPHRNAALGRPSTPEEIAFLREHPWGG